MTKRNRWIWIFSGLILASVLLFYAIVYMYDRPGGLLDQRMSQAMGQNNTIHIPLGKTPEEAIQRFRRSPMINVIHREPVEGGVLLFMKRNKQEVSNLQLEYVRKTWLGWKWGWGGEFSIGSSLQSKSALNYMSMPAIKGISTAFPLVFGDVLNASIKSVTVDIKGTGNYNAKLTKGTTGETIWFVFLPSTAASTPFNIEGYNEQGDLIAVKTISDSRDSGWIDLRD
ncbi:hypothetical protein [Paenibacillus wynnii]|uniref:hypothetical protein n=1 Tax=Paenibacillus wynnii TaxID=268407 RepID=UPI002790652C|nr:hypothetical protein [Paenibacillus wynnii]MDQ0194386.1 hypothetical protein [Paenibacillus wynnii]